MWGGFLEKADDDPYVSETGEPEYGECPLIPLAFLILLDKHV